MRPSASSLLVLTLLIGCGTAPEREYAPTNGSSRVERHVPALPTLNAAWVRAIQQDATTFQVTDGRLEDDRSGLIGGFGSDGTLGLDSGMSLSPQRLRQGSVVQKLLAGKQSSVSNRHEVQYDGGVTAWYLYGPLGLEQGFTISQPLDGSSYGDSLAVDIDLSGVVEVSAFADGLLAKTASGETLRYHNLVAWDAEGTVLQSHWEIDDNSVTLVVDTHGAIYPLTVDPLIASDTHLVTGIASDEDPQGEFGAATTLDGDWAAIGAPGDSFDRGAVYLLARQGRGWRPHSKLTGPDSGERFGAAVSLSSGRLLIGSPSADDGGSNSGRVSLFSLNGDQWLLDTEENGDAAGDALGSAVALTSTQAIAGAPFADAGGSDAGIAKVWTLSSSGFTSGLTLSASTAQAGANYGSHIAANADHLAIASPGIQTVYGYSWSGQWSDEVSESAGSFTGFGSAIAVHGNYMAVGAPDSGTGTAYVYEISTSALNETVALSYPTSGGNAGASIALTSDTLIVGSPNSNSAWVVSDVLTSPTLTTVSGSPGFGFSVAASGDAAVIGQTTGADAGSVWTVDLNAPAKDAELSAALPSGGVNDGFGQSVAIDGDWAAIGAPDSDAGGFNAGSVDVFQRGGTGWTHAQSLASSTPTGSERFGASVAIDGSVLAVGAPGAKVTPPTGSAVGAVHLFSLSGDQWAFDERVLGSDSANFDSFGESIALSGTTLIAGAPDHDVGAFNGGAAYIFTDSGSNWTEQQKLMPAGLASSDNFGEAVAIHGNRALIGAPKRNIGLRSDAGEAWFYNRSGTTWSLLSSLTAPSQQDNDKFGQAVATDGTFAYIGAPNHDTLLSNGGAVFVYDTAGQLSDTIGSASLQSNSTFGSALAIDGQHLLVGAPSYIHLSVPSGAAELFTSDGSQWTSNGLTLPAGLTANESFGAAVALSMPFGAIGSPDRSEVSSLSGGGWLVGYEGTELDVDLNGAAPGNDLSLVYVAGDGDVTLAPSAVVTDPLSPTLDSLDVVLTTAPDGAAEVLGALTGGTSISSSWNAGTRTLSLQGPAPLSEWQTVIRSVTYAHSDSLPTEADRVIQFVVDGAPFASAIVTVEQSNLPPVIDLNGSAPGVDVSVTHTAGSTPQMLADMFATVTDADDPTLSSLIVTITNPLDGTDELLTGTSYGPLNPVYDPSTGTLTVTGPGTLNNYRNVMFSVSYSNVATAPTGGVREVLFSLSDGSDTAIATASVDVIAPNIPPVITSGAGGTSNNNSPWVEGDGPVVLVHPDASIEDLNDTELEQVNLSFTSLPDGSQEVVSGDTSGTNITLSQSGTLVTLSGPDTLENFNAVYQSLTYDNLSPTPTIGTRQLTITAEDGDSTSNVVTVTIPITPVNTPVEVDLNGPSVAGTDTSVTWVEDAGPVDIATPDLTVIDLDDPTTTRIDASIAGYQPGTQEILAADTTGTALLATWDASTGILSVTGTGSFADYESVLSSTTYNVVSDNPPAGPRSISFGPPGISTAEAVVTVVAVDDPPALDLDPNNPGVDGTVTWLEDSGPSPMMPAALLTDPDGPNLVSLTVSLVGTPSTDDVLSLDSVPAGLNGTYDASNQTYSLTGPAPYSSFQTALQALSFEHLVAEPEGSTREFLVETSIGLSATLTLTIESVNDAPVIDASGPSTDTPLTTDYLPGDGALDVIAVDATITDEDTTSLQSLTATLLPFTEGDTLSLDAGTLTATVSDGSLSLSGVASLNAYETALRSLRYENAEPNLPAGTKTLTLTAIDEDGAQSDGEQVFINILSIGERPKVDLNGPDEGLDASATLIAGVEDSPVPAEAVVLDPDSDILSLTAELIDGLESTEVLDADWSGSAPTVGFADGVLSFAGPATADQMTDAIRTIVFSCEASGPQPVERVLSFTSSDAFGPGESTTLTISCEPALDTDVPPTDTDDPTGETDDPTEETDDGEFEPPPSDFGVKDEGCNCAQTTTGTGFGFISVFSLLILGLRRKQ